MIDPSTCKPGDAYYVELVGGRHGVGSRNARVFGEPWTVIMGPGEKWPDETYADDDVAALVPLRPEAGDGANMPGNPFAAASFTVDDKTAALYIAIMALAFEQRTANLIAHQEMEISAYTSPALIDDLSRRLGYLDEEVDQ